MANMAYCRFQNTLRDLQDCVDALEEGTFLEGEELYAYQGLMELCEFFAKESQEPLENDPDDFDLCTECNDPDCEGC